MLTFTVYGEAIPQGSLRAFTPKGGRRPILTADNPRLKSWRQLVAEAARLALQQQPASERGLLLEGVRLTVAFSLPRPKSLPRRVTANIKKPDLDKLVRATFDALTGVVWQDDSQIVELVAGKGYAALGAAPHAEIRVEPTAGITLAVVPPALPLFGEVGHD